MRAHQAGVAVERGRAGRSAAPVAHRPLGRLAREEAHQLDRRVGMPRARGTRRDARRRSSAAPGAPPRVPRHGRDADPPRTRRVGQPNQIHRVRPAAEEDRAAVAEGAAGQLLVGGRDPRRAHAALDQRRAGRRAPPRARSGSGKAGRARRARACRWPRALQHVAPSALVLLALPQDSRRGADRAPRRGCAAPARRAPPTSRAGPGRTWRGDPSVVQQAHVHEPRQRPERGRPRRARSRRGSGRRARRGATRGPEVEDPARPRELGHPDHVQHHHVEAAGCRPRG